ncbi:fumarylacetoacetate hydrolase family protein [Microbacterium aurantiacum]|uniref:Fumarylacetoacetate hydrolase family protein n=1 Tax=Microbacterium aurantiacum TaxID=162393 RepID=A0AAJ2HB14_9MICO|nr:fumarylacetoacetate hydrolase family protein [Microbacterium aurantiacum]MDS0244260.1 fumarylacetoacetate hydrolase family protein [Microbacterium aurantiacum]
MRADGTDAGVLPRDAGAARLVGRIWDPQIAGPRVVAVCGDGVVDLSAETRTASELMEREDAIAVIDAVAAHPPRWSLAELAGAAHREDVAHLLAPIDLQVVKACGVTFVDSMIERVIEERVGGDPERAGAVRTRVLDALGGTLASVRPGSPEAARAKDVLREQGLWSQYLEVGIGPDPEVFTKAPVLSSVGYGAHVGVPRASSWNNPEPELVLVVASTGRIVGATLGNDVNLRDVEGRSALLLGKAKDNNASSAIGPFVRMLDDGFALDALRDAEITLRIDGEDGFALQAASPLSRISRTFEELVAATVGAHHQYPDGFALYTGTMFAPTTDRDEPGAGFTHHPGDVVEISSPRLGTLRTTVGIAEELPPWTFGLTRMLRHLDAQRTPLLTPLGADA